MLFRVESKGVHVDTGSRASSVMLIRLNNVEVSSITYGESVLSVELELSRCKTVTTNIFLISSVGRVSVISPSVLVSSNVRVELENPDKFLARVVKSKLRLNSRVAVRFSSSELELLN
jgi:hypothetical protein